MKERRKEAHDGVPERFRNGYDPKEMAEYQVLGDEFKAIIKGGDALQATGTATTVKVRSGKRQTSSGPFARTDEQLTGYYRVEARDEEEALALAAKIPAARHGSVEVRPVMKFS
jgi:hypothetical protein